MEPVLNYVHGVRPVKDGTHAAVVTLERSHHISHPHPSWKGGAKPGISSVMGNLGIIESFLASQSLDIAR